MGRIGGRFFLHQNAENLAEAKHARLGRAFTIQAQGTSYRLTRAWCMGRSLTLLRDGNTLGRINIVTMFSRRSRAELPADIPLETQVFIFWLGTVIWRRDASEVI